MEHLFIWKDALGNVLRTETKDFNFRRHSQRAAAVYKFANKQTPQNAAAIEIKTLPGTEWCWSETIAIENDVLGKRLSNVKC